MSAPSPMFLLGGSGSTRSVNIYSLTPRTRQPLYGPYHGKGRASFSGTLTNLVSVRLLLLSFLAAFHLDLLVIVLLYLTLEFQDQPQRNIKRYQEIRDSTYTPMSELL